MLAEIELLMHNCNKNCLKRISTRPKQGVRCRRCPVKKGVHFREGSLGIRSKWRKKISQAENGSRNIPLTTNVASLTISKLFGLSVKVGKIKILNWEKNLSDASMSTV